MGRGRYLLASLLLLQLAAGGCTLTDSRANLLVDGPAPPTTDLRLDQAVTDLHPAGPDLPPGSPDTEAPFPDLGLCPAECINSCAGGICRLDCSKGCTCPDGYACQVDCKGDTCSGKIDCTRGTSCNVNCEQNACSEAIDCGPAQCTINCSQGSCGGPILCGAGGCKITCSNDSCHNQVRCQKGRCDIQCSSSSCKGTVECSTACACALTCSTTSCVGSKIKCVPGCKYSFWDGCTASKKFSGCDTC